MTVTLDDSERLHRVGISILHDLAFFSTLTLLHGVFIMVFSIAVYTTLRRGLKSRQTLAIFILIIICFTSATLYWATWMAAIAIQIRTALVQNVGVALSEKLALANAAIIKPVLIQPFGDYVMRICNDIAVIWRAWVLFPEHQWVMIGPLFFLFSTFGVSLAFLAMNTIITLSANGSPTQQNMNLVGFIDVSAIALSMATNLLATLLIAYKLWHHRKSASNLGLPAKKRRSDVQNVLFLLVESGAFFLALQLASLLLEVFDTVPGTAADYAAEICYAVYSEITAMYPALILLIVNKERSIVNTFGFSTTRRSNSNTGIEGHTKSTEHRPATVGHLVFASLPTNNSTVDNEGKAECLGESDRGGPESSDSRLA